MAGQGSRFSAVGIDKPKHEISVRSKPMFDWAMESLSAFYDEEFVFITQSEHDAEKFLTNACDRLGIESYSQVTLTEYTNGQAATALAASDHVSDNEALVIYNIDTYIEEGVLRPSDILGDGYIPVFTALGERWSFIREDEDGTAVEVSEKEKISDNATAGFYYFDRWDAFTEAYEARSSSVEDEYGETYVAPLYNHLIENGDNVVTDHIDRESVHVLGTPQDLGEFDSEFDARTN